MASNWKCLLAYDGANYVPVRILIPDNPSDIGAISAPASAQDGDFLQYDGTSGEWVSATVTIPSSASDVGAIPEPASPTAGQFLVYDGSSWVAQTLSTWSAGSY